MGLEEGTNIFQEHTDFIFIHLAVRKNEGL